MDVNSDVNIVNSNVKTAGGSTNIYNTDKSNLSVNSVNRRIVNRSVSDKINKQIESSTLSLSSNFTGNYCYGNSFLCYKVCYVRRANW